MGSCTGPGAGAVVMTLKLATWYDQEFVPEGVQNRPSRDGPLGHVNYFQLKAIETLRVHKKLLPLPERI